MSSNIALVLLAIWLGWLLSISCQPSKSCSLATCDELLVKLFGWSCCHVVSLWMISCWSCGLCYWLGASCPIFPVPLSMFCLLRGVDICLDALCSLPLVCTWGTCLPFVVSTVSCCYCVVGNWPLSWSSIFFVQLVGFVLLFLLNSTLPMWHALFHSIFSLPSGLVLWCHWYGSVTC